MASISAPVRIDPVGLCGVVSRMADVRGVMRAAISAASDRDQ